MGPHRKARCLSREFLRNVLDDYPLLDAIFAQILYEPRFVIVLASIVATAFAVFVSTLRLTQSPPHFQPVVKASFVDKLQAQNLARSARKAERAGNPGEAVQAWALAIAQNPADVSRLREFLQVLLRQEPARLRARAAASYGPWLLRLARTNEADLSLCLQLFAKAEIDEHLFHYFALWRRELPPELIVPRLRLLYTTGRFAAVPEFWREHLPRIPVSALPEAELYKAACLSLSSAGAEAEAARETLRAAQSTPALKLLALRLRLQLASITGDLEGFEAAHQELAAVGELRFADDLGSLELAVRLGRPDRAKLAADRMLLRPGSAREALACGSVLYELGLAERATEVLEAGLDSHPEEPALWRSYANLLIAARNWDKLEKTAQRMLQHPAEAGPKLAALARYSEGLAALGQHRRASASAAFQAIPDAVLDPGEGLALVRKMALVGFPSEGRRLLQALVARTDESPEYWSELARCAFDLGETELLAAALEAAHARNPADFLTANNYAAALLASRHRAAEALRLTAKNLATAPNRIPARINHALALLQNGESEQAAALLMTVDPAALESGDASAYHLACFELAADRNDLAAAREYFARIELRFLLPSEISWLNARRLRLESELGSPSGPS